MQVSEIARLTHALEIVPGEPVEGDKIFRILLHAVLEKANGELGGVSLRAEG